MMTLIQPVVVHEGKKNHTEREKDIIFEDYAEHLLQ